METIVETNSINKVDGMYNTIGVQLSLNKHRKKRYSLLE